MILDVFLLELQIIQGGGAILEFVFHAVICLREIVVLHLRKRRRARDYERKGSEAERRQTGEK